MYTADVVDNIIALESGEMAEEDIVPFFQRIIDSGLVWRLQGSYGRTAAALINARLCHIAETDEGSGNE